MAFPKPRLFTPIHPEKYVGDAKNIIARSQLERRFMKIFDENPNVISWGSEEMHIKYFSKIDKKERRYFPDFVVKVKNKVGQTRVFMIEIKPYAQTVQPKLNDQKNQKRFLAEMKTWQINQDKWQAAENFCKEKGIGFYVCTENELKNIW